MSEYSFTKSERLCNKVLIQNLFEKGNCVVTQFPFRIIWTPVTEPEWPFPAQVLISVSKRSFKKSVTRNKIKRQIRELYRKNKSQLYQTLINTNQQVSIAIIFQGNKIFKQKEMEPAFLKCLEKCNNQLQKSIEK